MSKWINIDAGPIQVKRVNKAISSLDWEGKTFYTAHRGFLGDPVDPDDLKYATTEIFLGREKGPLRTDAAANEIGEKWDWTITKKNAALVIKDFEEATVQYAKDRPVRDERRTREEDAEIKVVVAEHDAVQKAARAIEQSVTERVKALAPANAEAVIVAQLKEDTSDSQTDYFSNKTERSVAIGFRTGKREDFKQLHRAAASFPETAHLGSQEALDTWVEEKYGEHGYGGYIAEKAGEHRDNYSMGAGNYLSDHGWDGSGSGWVIKSYTLDAGWWTVTEIADTLSGVSA